MLDRSDGPSLRDGFLRQAALHPRASAISVRGTTRSYAYVDEAARRWANALIRMCGPRPQRIGLFAYRSEVAYIGTLAALFAGATYVPLNPTFPAEKTMTMASEAELDAVIADATCIPQVQRVFSNLSCLRLLLPDSIAAQDLGIAAEIVDQVEVASVPPLANLPPISAEDVAYLLFTSGSTGKPKGVPVTHANAVHFMEVMSRRYKITADDRFSQTFDQTFDLSVFDLFMAWSNGACVYGMAPVDLLSPTRYINTKGITVWFSVPSVPVRMCRRNTLLPNTLPTLRLSLFCGEPLLQRSAEMWQQAAPNSILENLYGPTELTIACFLHRWDSLTSPPLCHNGIVPIGRPYEGLAVMLIGDDLQPVKDGQPGELCVNGPQTTPGYWRNAETTSERYVCLPVSPYEHRRFYRTGDLVKRLPNGEYVFLGRADNQIKVLGHRLELGEIEAVLRGSPGVEHAIACGWPQSSPTTADGVVAFVTGSSVDKQVLLDRARAVLPPYAVPTQIITVSEMPLNANKKVDRRALEQRLRAATNEAHAN